MNRIDRREFVKGVAAFGLAALGGHQVSTGGHAMSTISDNAGHEMPYAWRPASNPKRARTLVILHGHGPHGAPSTPSTPGWNFLVPIDRYGPKEEGSWWLGEDGDFFVMNLLHTLIREKRREIGRDAGLYFAGSSMGGYGSILHGMLLGARAVYANAFQSRLTGTAFTDALSYAIDPIGVPAGSPFNDLRRYVRGKATLPAMFLDFNRDDHASLRYYDEHFVPFVAACKERGATYRATVYPVAVHAQQRSFADVLRLFDRGT